MSVGRLERIPVIKEARWSQSVPDPMSTKSLTWRLNRWNQPGFAATLSAWPSPWTTTSGCYKWEPLHWARSCPASPSPPFWLHSQLHYHMVRGPLPHPDTLAITNSSLPTKSCRKLAWKASAQCFGQLLFLASFSPLSRLCFNRTWDLTIFWGHSNFSGPLAGCHLPPQSSSCTCWKFQPFLHLTLLLLLNPQSPTRKTPWFCSPFKDMYSYHAWCVSVGISGWGSHVHLMEWGTASQESLY